MSLFNNFCMNAVISMTFVLKSLDNGKFHHYMKVLENREAVLSCKARSYNCFKEETHSFWVKYSQNNH